MKAHHNARAAASLGSPRHLFYRLLILLPCIGLGGCGLVMALLGGPDLQGMQIVSLEYVEDMPEFFPELPRQRRRPGLRVTITAERNLAAYSRSYEYTMVADAALCRHRQLDPNNKILTSVRIDDAETGREIDFLHEGAKELKGENRKYVFYIDVVTELRLNNSGASRTEFYKDHDLRRDHDDLCFQLRGGNMLGSTHRSNVVRIPYATIRAALDRTGQ